MEGKQDRFPRAQSIDGLRQTLPHPTLHIFQGQEHNAMDATPREFAGLADILAVLEDQFYEMRRQLDVQLTRFAQPQTPLDRIHKLLKQIVKEPD